MYRLKNVARYELNVENGLSNTVAIFGRKVIFLLAGHCVDIGLYGVDIRLELTLFRHKWRTSST